MSLTSGSRLGNFEILSSLGAGGMGEVFRARDHVLGRDVAIKVLPDSFAGDPERSSRFEREARLLAAVNHPGLAAIYGMEEWEGRRFIVMELVPGRTLEEMLSCGPLALAETISFSIQMAEGLEAAHAHGIIHRDLKPANVKVTPDGRAKILDLGLAKALDTGEVDRDVSKSPTVVLDQTRPGVILGTAEFMSPEQARGRMLDQRSDIWSFGCLLFEMLTGRRAFSGGSISDILAAILTRQPDWSAIPRGTPAVLRDLLDRCLEKDRNERLQHIGEARITLERLRDSTMPGRSGSHARKRSALAGARGRWIAAGCAIAAGAGLAAFLVRPRGLVLHDRLSFAVLPFRDLSDPGGVSRIGDGLVETLGARLSRVPGVQVVFSSETIAVADRFSDPMKIARNLGVGFLVRGAIQHEGDRLRITYSVIRAPAGEQVAGGDVTGPAAQLFDLQDRLSDSVAVAVRRGPPSNATVPEAGLAGAEVQARYLDALGRLQRRDRQADVDRAVDLLSSLERDSPRAAIVPAALARACVEKFDFTRERSWLDKAQAACARAEALAPDLAEAFATRGEIGNRTGRFAEAAENFRRAIAKSPNDMGAWLGLADALGGAERAVEAEATYRRAIDLAPAFWAGYSRLAGFYSSRGNYSRAARLFRRVTQLAPDSAVAFANLGGEEALIGEFDAATEAYRRSLELEANDLAWSNLGTVEFYGGRYADAARAFQKASEIAPNRFEYAFNLGDALRWTPGEGAKAAAAYERGASLCREQLHVNPVDARARSILSLCLAKTGDLLHAREASRRALELDAGNPEILYNAAIVESISGHPAEALELVSRAARKGYPTAFAEKDPEFEISRRNPAFSAALRGAAK